MHDRAGVSQAGSPALDEREPQSTEGVELSQRDGSSHIQACPVCASATTERFMEVRGVPVFCNILWPTLAQAMAAAQGDLELTLCGNCGHVFNSAFDQARMTYSEIYENSLHYSRHFSSYAERLAAHLVNAYHIRDKDVIDVGCGRGDFLSVICNAGNNRGFGFDKSYAPNVHGPAASENVTFICDFYGAQYASYPCDLLCCRHVLEHVEHPDAFIGSLRATLAEKKDVVVFFEVPNAAYTLRDLGIWDLIYEHCSYFSASSLHRLFARHGFAVRNISELYDGQFIGIECTLAEGAALAPACGDPRAVRDSVDSFPARYRSKLEHWRRVSAELERTNRRAVIWGGGSKGVTFLNLLKPPAVTGVIDLNPRKHGRYVPGTGHAVMSPDRLPELMPDVVIIMNEVYKEEIRTDLKAMGLSPELLIA